MNDIEMLREAARLMRYRAAGATQGPWEAEGETVGVAGEVRYICDTFGLADKWPNAQHIASWHPAVALAVADWLDGHCTDLASAGGDRFQTDSPGDLDHALAVARAYLGAAR